MTLVEELGVWEDIERIRMLGSGLTWLTTVTSGGIL
jgi:hypothetical protein